MTTSSAKHIHITGVVQGVGFRPFVYGLATRHDLRGWGVVRSPYTGKSAAARNMKLKLAKEPVTKTVSANRAPDPPGSLTWC